MPIDADPQGDTFQKRAESTLLSVQEFLDDLIEDALGADPRRRYRVDGKRKTIDLGKRWILALDERPVGLLNSVGVGIPAAGQPSRTWELLHTGRINDLRFYNHKDGSGRENGASDWITLAPDVKIYGSGLRLRDTYSGVARTDGQAGVRFGPSNLWVEAFARRATLDDTQNRQNWNDSRPGANFVGVQGQWEAAPGLSLTAQTQRAVKSEMVPGDERLLGPRTEFGADYKPDGNWAGTRFYWREATQLSLLSSNGLEERATYKRVFGVEAPEGSPDGMVYTQIRQKSLLSDDDALLVLGWRHTEILSPKWTARSLIESGIPVSGDNAVRSNTVDLQLTNDDFPRHVFRTEVQAVTTPLLNTGFVSSDFTKRITQNSLTVLRATVSSSKAKELPTDTTVYSSELSMGWGWQEPEKRLFSTFWRYTFLGGHPQREDITVPGLAERRARIGFSEFTWQTRPDLGLLLRASRRWDRNDGFQDGAERTTNLVVTRATKQIAERWNLSAHVARWNDSAFGVETGFGSELSVRLNHKVTLALGFNFKGIDDDELANDDRLKKGVTARLYIPTEAVLTRWLSQPMNGTSTGKTPPSPR
jgi:hypothetical protein